VAECRVAGGERHDQRLAVGPHRSGVIGRCVGGEIVRATPATSEAEGVCIFGSTDCVIGVSRRHADEGALEEL
jgi:dienelactone hydrolase